MLKRSLFLIALLASAAAATTVCAQSTEDELAKYREMLSEDNPADLIEAKGAELWKTPRGPKHATLEQCDLGRGAGVLIGAYTSLPRYFADTGRVQDIESRLVTCISTLQGISEEDASKNPFAANSDMQALVAYVAGQSKGQRIAVSLAHAKEQQAYDFGKQLFYYRAGPYDFSCASCHAMFDKRVRLQKLVNLTDQQEAQTSYASWPAYRYSQGELRTMQHRIWDCMRQQRFPELRYNSDAAIALTMFMAHNANGGVSHAPGIKR